MSQTVLPRSGLFPLSGSPPGSARLSSDFTSHRPFPLLWSGLVCYGMVW